MKSKAWFALMILILFFGAVSIVFSQTTGKISGKITDAETGDPLVGANVILEDTYRGAAADARGEYFIINVPPGTYTVRVQVIGYEIKRIENVRVSVNRTVPLNISLKQAIVEGETVVIQADRAVVKKDQTNSVRNVSADQIENLPVEDMGAVINMQAGVVEGHIRGGRITEVAYLIDGMEVTESFGGAGRSVDVEPEVVEDLEVITGTFNAEYGNAMSGIVNAVTKSGASTFHGSVSASAANYLTGNKDIFIGLSDTEFLRNQDYKVQLSGPVIPGYLSFFTNLRYQENKNHLNGIHRFNVKDFSTFESNDPDDWYSEHTGDGSFVPMNSSKNLSFMGKLSARFSGKFNMSLLYTRNQDEWNGYDHAFKYNPYGTGTTHRLSQMINFELTHMISDRLFYDLKFSGMQHEHGWYVFENPLDSAYVHDKFFRADPGFYTGGQQKGHDERMMQDLVGKFDVSWQMNKNHLFKTGVKFTQHVVDNNYKSIRNAYYGTDLENLLYEPEILPDTSIYTDQYKVEPYAFSAYIQDKMEFQEMVINMGVRFDYFNPNTVYPSQWRNPANQLNFPSAPEQMSQYLAADAKMQWSPRVGISYLLGKAAILRFSYGHFFKMPPMYALYQNSAFRVAPTDYATTMGNPRLKAEKTVSYELGLWQEIFENMGLEIALFYRDIYDLLSARVITTYNQIEYGLYSNIDYGNAKGLELKYDFRFGGFSTYLNYTLQFTRGNADNPTQTFDRAGNSMDPIPRMIPMSWDQRHTLNVTVGYNGRNYGATLTGYYNSGSPYTWTPIEQSRLAKINLYPNNAWRPGRINVDLAGFYDIPLIMGTRMRLTLNVYNLFDRLNEMWVNSYTGRAYTDIIQDVDIAGHRSDFNTYEDIVQNPSMYAAPRLIKMGLELMF